MARKGFNTYRLKNNITAYSWKLPTKNVMAKRRLENGEKVLKHIQYVPDAKSIWKEDYKGDAKPQAIWFINGKLEVHKADKLLNEFLTRHQWYGTYFEIEDEDAKNKLENQKFGVKFKAMELIKTADVNKKRAIAMAVFGAESLNWDDVKVENKLFYKAIEDADGLLKKVEGQDYDSMYIAHLAFQKGIVKYNNTKTAIVWNSDEQGEILRLAKGENGIQKLYDYFYASSDEAVTVIQEIGSRLRKSKDI